MYIDMDNYKIEDLKNEKDKQFILGYDFATDSLKDALYNYLDECRGDDHSIAEFERLRKSILNKFVVYAQEFLKNTNDLLLVEALDKQACEESNAEEETDK